MRRNRPVANKLSGIGSEMFGVTKISPAELQILLQS